VRREKKSPAAVERQLRRDLDRLEARINPIALNWAARLLDGVFNRIYQGIEVDLEGLQRIREQARKGPVILLPSHKSHLDYLLLSFVFYTHGLQCPLIAAGDNLAFWPAGPILRRCGAFFIRRSFKGARLYTTLVDTYVRKILKEGYAIEFFVEGGRSRSGKVLPPKVGLLSMVADAADAAHVEVAYVPISIGYEQIVEQRSYIEELSGGEKRKEDAGALLTKAPRVLTTKYGRAYVQVGQILHFNYQGKPTSLPPPAPEAEATTARAAKRAALDRMQARRAEVSSLASRVVYEINRVTPVTPNALLATALLASLRRGIARSELLARIDQLVHDLRRAGARFAESLAVGYEGTRRLYRVDAIDQALNVFQESALIQVHGSDGDAIYQVPDDKRLALDYYKNNLIHFFAPTGLLASALVAEPAAREDGVAKRVVLDRVTELTRLLKPEFQLKSETDVEFDTALDRLVEAGEVEVTGEGPASSIRIASSERIAFHAGLLRNFVESYIVAARSLELLLDAPMPAKELLKKALGTGERMFLTGEIAQREAVSKPNIENALQSFRDAGYLSGGEGGPQRLAPGHDTLDAVRALEASLRAFAT
jgi:glycerol-3-phosphate O-acyltransferase